MKIFLKILYGIAIITIFIIFFDSGKAARDEKYIKDVILKNKGENTLINNKDETFVAQMFALNDLIYKKEKIGNISFNEDVSFNDEIKNILIDIDFYQTLSFSPSSKIKDNYHGVVNIFSVDGDISSYLTFDGYYEKPLYYENHKASYTVNNLNFPLFGLNDTLTSDEFNALNSVIVKTNNVELFEIVVTKSTSELTTKYDITNFDNYPSVPSKMYDDILNTLSSGIGRFNKPDDDELKELNNLGYNYHYFTGQEVFNYIIYIYLTISFALFVLSLYFIYLKPYYKSKKTNLS